MMPPADRIREQNEQDPGRVAHTRQEAGSNDFLAPRILQLNVDGISAAKRSFHGTREINKKGKGSPHSITERRVPELIPVLGSQPAGDVSHKPGGRLPLLSARPAVTPATLKRAATNFAAW